MLERLLYRYYMARKKKDHYFSIITFNIVNKATEPKELNPGPEFVGDKNPYAIILGRHSGSNDGKARAAKLTEEQRSEIAKKDAAKRREK